MDIHDTIDKFLKNNNYSQDPHVLGVLFYGSYKHKLNNSNSDLDLQIIYDDSNPERIIRANTSVDGIRIEYFEKPISEIYRTADEGYLTQDNSPLSIIGKSEIIYEKDNKMHELQDYVVKKYKDGVLSISENEAQEQVSIINNRMERLKKYAAEDSYYFEHLYHLTIEKIRRFYHNLNGMPRIETSKGFKLYTDKKYQEMYSIHHIPNQEFLNMYFNLITSQNKSKTQMYDELESFYNYAKRTVDFDDYDYRIPVTWRYKNPDIEINKNIDLSDVEKEHIPIPENVLNTTNKFIQEMNYMDNPHFLGVIVYGSSLTGNTNELSDIDLHVIFDNNESGRVIRGKKYVNDQKIEYFEKSIGDEYLMVENEFASQNNASFAILGKGEIVYARDNSLDQLQKYVIHRYKDKMPPLSTDDAREQISIIDNKVQKLDTLLAEDSPYFNHYYHIVLEKMRKVHHKIIGISQIPTSKVHIIYTDEAYRKASCKTNPPQDFVDDYLRLITPDNNKTQNIEQLKLFCSKVKNNIELGTEYRIPIKSRCMNLPHASQIVSSSTIAALDKDSKITKSETEEANALLCGLKNKNLERKEEEPYEEI